MPNDESQSPQLVMVRNRLDDLPEVELPGDCALRTYRPGDAPAWKTILNESFERPPGHMKFDAVLRADPAFRPERIFFVLCDGRPVASASAWRHPVKMPDAGAVHYVGVRKAYRGRRLGYQVSLAALHRMRDEGLDRAWLLTDDFRLAAVKTYLDLGFRPLLVHENQRERWRDVFDALGLPELKLVFADALDGPIHRMPHHPEDDFDYEERVFHRRRWNAGRRPGRTWKGDIDAYGDESLYRPSQLGAAGANVAEVEARAEHPFELWFRVGPAGLPAGSEVLFWTPGQRPLGSGTQTDDPARRGFVEVTEPGGVEPLHEPGFRTTRELGEGEEVRLAVGRTGGFRWTPLAGRKEFKVVVDVDDGEPLMRLPEPVVVRVRPRRSDHLDVFLPGTSAPGDTVRATVTVRDEFDNRVPRDGVVELRMDEHTGAAHLSGGICQVELPVGGEPAFAEAAGPPGGHAARSNWCLPGDGPHLYFGDLHAHDLNSAAEGYTDEVYRWAREDKRLDFLAVPCQVHGYLDNDKWAVAKQLCEMHLHEGRFVTLLSFEWQHSHCGDKVVHYLGGDAPYLPIDDDRYAHPAALYEALRGTDALVISHHPGYALDQHVPGTDWDAMETDVDRLVELWSMHGSSEGYGPDDRPMRPPRREGGVMDGLRRGLRFGFTGGSDTHSARPGGSAKEPRPYWGGLCAVWAGALTRRALFDALRARRTVALTGARIALRLSVNGAPMGSELPLARERRLVA
ncbi:MAG: GNAT family N-acetyltransferase, partial [Planctomycetota bacterium]